jgi:transketolase
MLNSKAKLSLKVFRKDIEQIPTRNGFGEGLVEAGKLDEQVVVLSADLKESTRSQMFEEVFPDRFIEVGVAEQGMATIASGMANYGRIPFISSYAAFSPGRNWEQIRTTIALNNVSVKIAGAHAGLTVGPDGATHQALEDIALMRVMPNMVVIVPCDSVEAKKATIAAAKNGKPTYIRLTREKTPVFTTVTTPFRIGKAETFWDSISSSGVQNSKQKTDKRCAIIGCGTLVYKALYAVNELGKDGIQTIVINCHTISPIDEEAIVGAAKLAGAVVTVEEHQVNGGLGSAVAEVLARNYPVPDGIYRNAKPLWRIRRFGGTIG